LAARPRRLPRTAAQQAKQQRPTEIPQTKARLEKLQAQYHALPRRVPLAEAQKGQAVVKLSAERKHLTIVLKMVAYHMESDLLELIRPHYKRVEEEGRTFIQAALQDAADLEPTEDQLRITLAPLSSPHRSRVLEALPSPESNPHAVSGNSTRGTLRSRSVPSKPKKRTRFRGTMSGVLKLPENWRRPGPSCPSDSAVLNSLRSLTLACLHACSNPTENRR